MASVAGEKLSPKDVDIIKKFSRPIIESDVIEISKSGKVNAAWFARNETAKDAIGMLFEAVIGRQEWESKVIPALNDINKAISAAAGDKGSARILDYTAMLDYIKSEISSFM
jgi:hypothetical protein